MTRKLQSGSAMPISITTNRKKQGGLATPVYVVEGNQEIQGGPTIPVYVVDGTHGVLGGAAVPVYLTSDNSEIEGGDAIPVYDINGTLGEASLVEQINSYQSAINYVHAGGFVTASFNQTNSLSGGADVAGITAIDTAIVRRIRQDGFIYRASVSSNGGGTFAGAKIKFKVFRLNGANYDMVGESELIDVDADGVSTFTFTNPIPCQIGDYIGFWVNCDGANRPDVGLTVAAGGSVRWAAGVDVTVSNAFAGSAGDWALNIEAFSYRPFLCGTGDSIMAGWANRQSWYDAFSGPIAGDPLYQVQQLLPNLYYQNHAKGASGWDWVRTDGAVSALAVKPKYLLVHSGVNDIDNAVAWADVDADMDAVLALCVAAGTTLLVAEILPCNILTDAECSTLRTFNANYATWCANNGARLITMHDSFGKIRVATGELDDLIDAYNDDNTHLTADGKLLQASLYKSAL